MNHREPLPLGNNDNRDNRNRWRRRRPNNNDNNNDQRNRGPQNNDERPPNMRDPNNWRNNAENANNNNAANIRGNRQRANDNGNKPQRKRFYLGFKKLEELVNESSEDVLVQLTRDMESFAKLITDDLSYDYLVLIIKLLLKISEATFHEMKMRLLLMALDDKFIQRIVNFILNITLADPGDKRRNRFFWDNANEFFKNLCDTCKHMLDLIPNQSYDKLVKVEKALSKTMLELKDDGAIVIDDKTEEAVQHYKKKLDFVREEIERKNQLRSVGDDHAKEGEEFEPPENYKTLSIIPTANELLLNMNPFVRKNLIEGKYRDPYHYLDVQFRLLKEDFIGPLRDGIHKYINNNDKKIENIRIHKKVQFISKYNSKAAVGFLLKFNFTKKIRFNENSKRFIYGSLLCFTNTNFNTMFFGKVVERDVKLLNDGTVVVDLIDFNYNDLEYMKDYLMIECSIFFEPYHQVLEALRNFDENDFPLEDYLLYVDKTPKIPNYFRTDDNLIYFDIKIGLRRYSVTDLSGWPTAERLSLNDSQYNAFKNALTRQLVVIQGPPGTGKTYLGLLIAKTLLSNRELWMVKGPILVVCYTNHALDQFLEGIVAVTDNIVRIGGQSRSEAMKRFNIRNRRLTRSKNLTKASVFNNERRALNEILNKINKCVEYWNALNNFSGIVHIEKLERIDPGIRGTLIERVAKLNLSEWLIEDYKTDVVQNVHPDEVDINDENEDTDDSDMENVVDLDDDILGDYIPSNPYHVSFEVISSEISRKEGALDKILESTYDRDIAIQIERYKLRGQIANLKNLYQVLNENLNRANEANYERKPVGWRRYNDKDMPYWMRWHFYFYWLNLYRDVIKRKLEKHYETLKNCRKTYDEARDIMDLDVMKDCAIIGMTTTGAARMQATLRALKSPIVIVEEAAEVLESHVIVCLTKECEQLILIGDHQQLRPSTSNYELERNYNLGISMFERMIINDMDCDTLNVQHRMCPEISALISPSIYSDLKNARSVYGYRPIKGVEKSLYFVHHTNPESDEKDTTSRKNEIEANYMIQLAKYLVLNGYNAEDITLLAAYSAQMFHMRNERKLHSVLKGCKIVVLDNYQGEENKIILLSLVRNNNNNSIGFLSIENRVCVALSRAKEGMYVMGNMDMLCASSKIWPKIKEVLVKQDAMGTSLPLYCERHEITTKIQRIKDFDLVAEGGCNNLCNTYLICGHVCTKLCHSYDRDHIEYVCTERCNKILCELNHPCPDLCGEKCRLCKVLVSKLLPCEHTSDIKCFIKVEDYKCKIPKNVTLPCEHNADIPCHSDAATYPCPVICDSRVEPCGHSCTLLCHKFKDPDHLKYLCAKKCEKLKLGCQEGDHLCTRLCHEECEPCNIKVRRKRTICSHVYDVPCKDDVDLIECKKPCTRTMECNHKCKNMCFEECGPCKQKVIKTVALCGHGINVACNIEPDTKYCNGLCPLTLPCGHRCTSKCNRPCTTDCRVLVNNHSKAACGHEFKIPCSYQNKIPGNINDVSDILKFCTEPCNAILECSHKCQGTCGKCYQGRIHMSCQEKCGIILPCGHDCTAPCREACRPCQKKCSYSCKHSKCTKKCGEPCTPCKENCSRRCAHVKCAKKCGEICDVPPCTEPCMKKLKCEHPCVGYCGDQCPPLCRICDREELTELFLGYEDDEDSRFVYLQECGHTIESEGMEQWLITETEQNQSKEIKAAYCPKCKTTITSTPRYSNYVKKTCVNLAKIKNKYHGDLKKIEMLRQTFVEKCEILMTSYLTIITKDDYLMALISYFKHLSATVTKKNRRQVMDKMKIDTLNAKSDLLEEVLKILKEYNLKELKGAQYSQWFLNYFCTILMRNDDVIVKQEINDINMEISKYNRIMQCLHIQESLQLSRTSRAEVANIIEMFDKLINSIRVYTEEDDDMYKNHLIKLNDITKCGINISDREKKEILSAMGFARGHWYSCPNGHVYCIADCGGAMHESKCNECGATIGGGNHSLRSDNRVATEMDGARHSAWSEQANMLNYRL